LDSNETYNLLIRYIDGETSEEELLVMEALLTNDTYWANEYKVLLLLNQDIETHLHFEVNAKTENNWDALKNQIEAPKRTIKIWPSFVRYASAAIIILVAGWFLFKPSKNEFSSFGSGETYKTGNHQTKQITLSDGSNITLNENSSLVIDKNFNISNRLVELNGEAYFEITENKSKPFISKTRNTYTKVLGTSFEIEAKDESNIIVSLYNGKVQFVADKQSESLVTGEKLSYSFKNKSISKQKSTNLVIEDWSIGSLSFKSSRLIDIVQKLEAKYDIEIIIQEDKNNEQYTVSFEGLDMLESLRLLEELTDSKIIKKHSNYILKP